MRDSFTESTTGGSLSINDELFCYTLEDKDRLLETTPNAKVYGQTCIPRGEYDVVLDFSPKYQRIMPHVLNVPGFTGIRIHPGNFAEDTDGCILLGRKRGNNEVLESRDAFNEFFDKITMANNTGEHIKLTIA